MKLRRRLAVELAERYPDETASALESHRASEAAEFVERLPRATAAGVLQRTIAHPAASILAELPSDTAAEIVARLPIDVAAGYLRRMETASRDAILGELEARRQRSLRSLLRFPENTAGALMDPDVLALPIDIEVSEAVDRVRKAAGHARYNVYVVDREDRLIGVFNLRELLSAKQRQRLAAIAQSNVISISAESGLRAVIEHPGWREVHAIPVVDADGTYLGALRYRTLRRLEAERAPAEPAATATAQALGDLFQVGISGALEALAAADPASPKGRP